MGECCKAGFLWDGTPVGKETTLGKNKTYVTGSNKDVAVLMVHDVFGERFCHLFNDQSLKHMVRMDSQ